MKFSNDKNVTKRFCLIFSVIWFLHFSQRNFSSPAPGPGGFLPTCPKYWSGDSMADLAWLKKMTCYGFKGREARKLLFIELMSHLSNVKQMCSQPIHLRHKLILCKQITEIPQPRALAGTEFQTCDLRTQIFFDLQDLAIFMAPLGRAPFK